MSTFIVCIQKIPKEGLNVWESLIWRQPSIKEEEKKTSVPFGYLFSSCAGRGKAPCWLASNSWRQYQQSCEAARGAILPQREGQQTRWLPSPINTWNKSVAKVDKLSSAYLPGRAILLQRDKLPRWLPSLCLTYQTLETNQFENIDKVDSVSSAYKCPTSPQ